MKLRHATLALAVIGCIYFGIYPICLLFFGMAKVDGIATLKLVSFGVDSLLYGFAIFYAFRNPKISACMTFIVSLSYLIGSTYDLVPRYGIQTIFNINSVFYYSLIGRFAIFMAFLYGYMELKNEDRKPQQVGRQ